MEWIDVYDRDGQRTGKTIVRGTKFGPGEYCRIAQVLIFNSKRELLIQQRSEEKKGWPGVWDLSLCGGVLAGENSRQAAQRELKEELGLDHDFTGDIPHVTVFFGEGFSDVYIIHMEPDLDSLTLQKEEVQGVRWAEAEEIIRMIREGSFVKYHESWISFLFDREKYNSNFC